METNKEKVACCLKDIGCSSQVIEDFLVYYDRQDEREAILLLKKERCQLMEKLHQAQQKIDCLDYLLCQLKKGKL